MVVSYQYNIELIIERLEFKRQARVLYKCNLYVSFSVMVYWLAIQTTTSQDSGWNPFRFVLIKVCKQSQVSRILYFLLFEIFFI